MKTSIYITGSGISSKLSLKNALTTYDCQVKKHPFNEFEIIYNTKKEAVKALGEAYQYLKADKEDWQASCGSYCRGYNLAYDAAGARIIY